MKYILTTLFFLLCIVSYAQTTNNRVNKEIAKFYTPEYILFRNQLIANLPIIDKPKFGTTISGIYTSFETEKREIALTLDGCSGELNKSLINLLKSEGIPASLFVTGRWILNNKSTMEELATNPLFEIENHGLLHRVCSMNGRTVYKLPSTVNIEELVDEMEINARLITEYTGKRPLFFRSASAYMDQVAVAIAKELGMKAMNFDIISGDGVPHLSANVIKNNILTKLHPGGIIIMHFNHPEWNETEALKQLIPILRAKGYKFVKLSEQKVLD